jgi:hypothetical protein
MSTLAPFPFAPSLPHYLTPSLLTQSITLTLPHPHSLTHSLTMLGLTFRRIFLRNSAPLPVRYSTTRVGGEYFTAKRCTSTSSITAPLTHSLTLSLCYSLTLSLCHSATHSGTLSLCHCVLLPLVRTTISLQLLLTHIPSKSE